MATTITTTTTTINQNNQVQLTVDTPISHSITSFANHADLRKQVYMESMTACPENLDVLDALIQVRQDVAQALGFPSFAHRFLQDKMTPEAVQQFLNDLQRQIQPTYRQELATISRLTPNNKSKEMALSNRGIPNFISNCFKPKAQTATLIHNNSLPIGVYPIPYRHCNY
jgi:Zn-dependent oligopeptidase